LKTHSKSKKTAMNNKEELRKVVRQFIKSELDEATTTANVPGYQTPFAFSDKDDEKRKDDIEDFLDTYGYELAEILEMLANE